VEATLEIRISSATGIGADRTTAIATASSTAIEKAAIATAAIAMAAIGTAAAADAEIVVEGNGENSRIVDRR
jgi:hypothetical protein